MKSRYLKKSVSLMLTTVLTLSASTGVFATTQGIADVSSNVGFSQAADGVGSMDDVIIKVKIPTNLVYTIDPYGVSSIPELDGQYGVTDSQIHSPNYYILNKSNVNLEVEFKAVVSTSTARLTNANDVFPELNYKTTKDAYLAILTADNARTGAAAGFSFDMSGSVNSLGYVAANKVALSQISPADKIGYSSMLLGAATNSSHNFSNGWSGWEASGLAANKTGGSFFRLYGKLNTFAGWVASDLDIDGVFTIKPYTSSAYTKMADPTDPLYSKVGDMALNKMKPVYSPYIASVDSTTIEDPATEEFTIKTVGREFKETVALADFNIDEVSTAGEIKSVRYDDPTMVTFVFDDAAAKARAFNDKFVVSAKKSAFTASPDPQIDASPNGSNTLIYNIMQLGPTTTAEFIGVDQSQSTTGLTFGYVPGDYTTLVSVTFDGEPVDLAHVSMSETAYKFMLKPAAFSTATTGIYAIIDTTDLNTRVGEEHDLTITAKNAQDVEVSYSVPLILQ